MITIIPANSDDFKIIQEVAYRTWPSTYGEILSKEQLDFMLDAFYSIEALQNNLEKKGHQFILALEDEVCLGFASYEHDYDGLNKTHIHKIYILPETQGKGIGKKLLEEVAIIATKANSEVLSLNVNRYNKALSFYEKLGFQIIKEVDISIGNGYLMEDYIMEKQLV